MRSSITERAFQHLEKRYFEPGDLGFTVWRTMGGIFGMAICNDRRWPETYRVMGLQGVEMVLLGYNTPSVNSQKSEEGPEKRLFHNRLSVQAGAYQNSTWVVAVAKAGVEDGHPLFGGSLIVDPDGEIVAEAKTEERRAPGPPLRSRRHHLRQEDDLRLRAPPPHRALRPDHQPDRRGAAAGELDARRPTLSGDLLRDLDPHDRYKLLCGVVVPRPIALVTTLDANGSVNAAPFSFFNVFSEDPPLIVLGPAAQGRSQPEGHHAQHPPQRRVRRASWWTRRWPPP